MKDYSAKLVYRPPNIENMTSHQKEKYELAKKICSDTKVINLNEINNEIPIDLTFTIP